MNDKQNTRPDASLTTFPLDLTPEMRAEIEFRAERAGKRVEDYVRELLIPPFAEHTGLPPEAFAKMRLTWNEE